MKAMVYTQYGPPDVLRLEEIEKPVPKYNEVLVKVQAASVNALDWHLLRAKPSLVRLMSGLSRPKQKILGADVAGRVETVGKNVKQFQPGDDVFGTCTGAFAEYVSVPENSLAPKPASLSFEEAAAVPVAALTALQGLRSRGEIQPGQKVLINGASGGVGTFAVQLAKSFGAEVTAVTSTGNLNQARTLGADFVIDYTRENFTKNGMRYDRILAANGYHPIGAYKRALSPAGIYVMTGGSTAQMFQAMLLGPLISMAGKKKLGFLLANPNKNDLLFIKELLETGNIKPVIDRRYPLQEVPEAIRYVEAGHAKGKVIITLEQINKT
ncbi:MAG: NAD(P)-dependent alcohol dehydrogenase [candidate division Zixibacteria bacterium]|nr:NAD(P)-dependent alcohol dehydrogenase [candidate division Zixibacteria bacterium]